MAADGHPDRVYLRITGKIRKSLTDQAGKSLGGKFGSFGKTLGGNVGASLGRGILQTLFRK